MQASTAGSGASYSSASGLRIEIHSATCTAGWSGSGPVSSRDYIFAPEPKKPPKYDPGYARLMWARDILQETSRPKKRPSQQVQFNQVSRLRPVRPRYLSRKR